MKRAVRRLEKDRMKRKAARPYAGCGPRAVKYADHPAACSCAVCGNPRKYRGEPTRGELMATGTD